MGDSNGGQADSVHSNTLPLLWIFNRKNRMNSKDQALTCLPNILEGPNALDYTCKHLLWSAPEEINVCDQTMDQPIIAQLAMLYL